MDNTKLKEIKRILENEYGDQMSDALTNDFANTLYDSLFIGQYDLDDITAIIIDYETQANIEDSKWDYVFISIIDLLDNNETTAKRLYKSFMYDLDILDVLWKLVNENAEFLSAEELANVKKRAIGVFDEQILKALDIIE